MPRTPTTPAQISGHRFLVRRVEHALVRADARMLHDPLRTRGRAVAAGAALLVLVLAGTVILGLIRPRDGGTDADLLLVRDTGALHVRIDDRVHPVANLASARLVLGQPVEAVRVGAGALEGASAGHPVGIPAAPDIASADPVPAPPSVGVCEEAAPGLHEPVMVRSTVVRMGALPPGGDSALVTDGEATWLVHDGHRARIDARDPVLSRALGLAAAPVRPVGAQLLAAIPERGPVTAPHVRGHGGPSGFPAPFDVVGTVVGVGQRRVVVLDDGAVDVPPVVADVLAAGGGARTATDVELAGIPVAAGIDAGSLPAEVPDWAPAEGWLCVDADETATVVTHGRAPDGFIPYAGADGEGPGVDGFSSPVRSATAVDTGGGVHLVSAGGTRHLVENRGALAALGYPSTVAVPWRVLAAFREGPELTKAAALAAT